MATVLALLFQLERGQQFFRMKDWPAAERHFVEALRQAPSSAAAHKWLGMTYAAQEKFLLAEAPFRRACDLDPKEPDACYYLGRTLFTLSRFQAALDAYGKAAPKASRVLLGQALAHEALGRAADAARLFKEAIEAGDRQAAIDYERFKRKQAVAGPAVPPVEFVATPLPFTVRNGARGARRLIETMISGVAVIDYDADGWPDIFIANGEGSNGLLRNNRDGSFSDVAAQAGVAGPGWSMGASAADYDNDGHTDLFVTGLRAHKLFRNRGDATFEDVPFPQHQGWSVASAWLDADNDGWLDLFEVRYVEWDEAKEPYCGTATFRQYCHPRQYQPLANALYRNLGDGSFQDVSLESGIARHDGKGMGAAVGDYDGDGRLDIFVSNDTLPNFLFRNTGGGRFEEVGLQAGVAYNENGVAVSSMGAEFRDTDNDGWEDLFVTALTNETFPLFRNVGKGTFTDITLPSGIAQASLPWTGWSNAVVDLNQDGWKDLVSANGHVMDNAELSSGRQSKQPNQVFLNRQRSFSAVTLPGTAFHRGLAWADFDRDGRIDLVVTRLNEPAQLLWNRSPQAGNWIAFDLRGTKSNRDGVGTMVEIRTGPARQWNRSVASSGYGCSSWKLVHFGLGAATRVDSVVIRWPSGVVQTLSNLPAGSAVRVEEAEDGLAR
jgi:tetratricopeptide (TPR) repeat protein